MIVTFKTAGKSSEHSRWELCVDARNFARNTLTRVLVLALVLLRTDDRGVKNKTRFRYLCLDEGRFADDEKRGKSAGTLSVSPV